MGSGVVWWGADAMWSWFRGHGVPKSVVVACGEVGEELRIQSEQLFRIVRDAEFGEERDRELFGPPSRHNAGRTAGERRKAVTGRLPPGQREARSLEMSMLVLAKFISIFNINIFNCSFNKIIISYTSLALALQIVICQTDKL